MDCFPNASQRTVEAFFGLAQCVFAVWPLHELEQSNGLPHKAELARMTHLLGER